MTILAIETSCDETSAAVIRQSAVVSNVISSQLFHGKYGGVVPELASRAHLQYIGKITDEALRQAGIRISDVDLLAVTTGPGLAGSLVVGSSFTKGLSLRYGLQVVPVNHIEGHIYSGCIDDPTMAFPFISLVVSGGHTGLFYVESFSEHKTLGLTRDDAAGEAFDKIAKLLGFGYPGGPAIDRLAKSGNPKAYNFPRSMIASGDYGFSFSGLKTSVRYFLAKYFPTGVPDKVLPDICASVQEAIVDVLVHKSVGAATEYGVSIISISGGVSSNSRLRAKLAEAGADKSIRVVAPGPGLCSDNAAMVGFIAEKKLMVNDKFNGLADLTFCIDPNPLRDRKRGNQD